MLVRVLPDFHQDVSRGMLANWLYTVAHNAALNAARRSRRHPETILPERAVEAVPSHGLNPSLEAEIGEFWDRIRSSLSPDELELLDAHFLHGCQPKEIVAARRLAPSTVYRHLTSLRHKIIAIIDSLSESDTVP